MKSYNELEHLNSRISIYRRVTRKGEPGSFYARIRIADGKPYSVRSLGTKSAEVARDEALNLYHDLLTNPSKQTGLTINGLVEKYKNSSSSNLSKPRNTLTGRQKAQIIDLDHIRTLIGDTKVNAIDSETESHLYQLRSNTQYFGKKVSPQTVHHTIIVYRQLIKWAYNNQYIDRMPALVTRQYAKTKRSPFTSSEVRILTQALTDKSITSHTARQRHLAFLLLQGLRIIRGSGVRPGELLKLRVRDVEISTTRRTEDKIKYTNKNIVLKVSGKTNLTDQRIVPVLDTAIRPINELLQYLKEQNNNELLPHQSLFAALNIEDNDSIRGINTETDSTVQSGMQRLLKKTMRELDIEDVVNSKGHTQPKSLYSARHLFITEQLEKGLDVYMLARTCGNSVAIIQEYYDEMNLKHRDVIRKISHSVTGDFRQNQEFDMQMQKLGAILSSQK